MTAPFTRQAAQTAAITCPGCHGLFVPRRRAQTFCSDKCRSDYHRDHGIDGRIKGVRRIKSGVSVVIWLSGPAAEAALKLELGQSVRVSRARDELLREGA